MPSLISSTVAVWTAVTPAGLENLRQADASGERILRWGVPIAGEQSLLGFLPESPPSQTVEIGEEFSLGRVRVANRPIAGSGLTAATLTLTTTFSDDTSEKLTYSIPLVYTDEAGGFSSDITPDELRFVSDPPFTVETGYLRLRIVGFSSGGGLAPNLVCAEGDTIVADLRAVLESSPEEDESCENFVPVFAPVRCDVEPLCPIADLPIIEDCGIPEAPLPIFDCPDIDIPVPALSGRDSAAGSDFGFAAGSCYVRVQVQTTFAYTFNYAEAGVFADVVACPPDSTTTPRPGFLPECCYLIRFYFVFFHYYPYKYGYDCCPFLWCSDAWLSLGGETCAAVAVPEVSGRWAGELVYVCDCDSTTTPAPTTTTTTASPETPECTGATDTVMFLCNHNSGGEGTIELNLNGTNIGTLDLSISSCRSLFWRTDPTIGIDVLASELSLDAGCCSTPDSTIELDEELLVDGDNTLEFDNTADNGYGSNGQLIVAQVQLIEGEWVLCHVLYNMSYDIPDGADGSVIFPWPFGSSSGGSEIPF